MDLKWTKACADSKILYAEKSPENQGNINRIIQI